MFANTKISKLVGSNTNYVDHIGVEIEAEHGRRPDDVPQELTKYWRAEADGSLRKNGVEYVMREPRKADVAKRVVKLLGKQLDKFEVLNTGRAGIHVHVNVGDLTVRELTNFVTLFHVVEPLAVNWCGEYRRGNLFCLRLKDAEFIVDKFTEALETEDLRKLHTDDIRYASINLKAVPQYGSVEFRCMRSDGNWNDICTFIDFVLRLKTLAREIDNPVQIVADSSAMDREDFVRHILGEFAEVFPRYKAWEDDVEFAIRRIQYYAYCKEW